jgi:CHAT domain-containing protein
LAVIPDAAWSQVAWPVLWDRASGVNLVERTAVMIAPSAAVALRDRAAPSRRPGERVLVLSAPRTEGRRDLPSARLEAREIAALYRRNELLEGAAATPDALLDRAPHVDILHVAGHAMDVPSYPRLSHLLLWGEGEEARLFAHEIASTDLSRIQLVVLAACATAGRATVRGEGTVGVAWGFLTAGARRVVATLQEIEDGPARELFTGMHRRIAAGMRPMQALHAVQREMAAAGESPRVWAAVTVIGTM